MTERRRRKPSAVPIAALAVSAFMALFGFMSYELSIGHDPALGRHTTVVAQAPKRVVVRRIEDDIVVTRVVPAPVGARSAPIVTASSGGQPAAAPVPSAPVVVQSAPPVVQSGPAPVATRTS